MNTDSMNSLEKSITRHVKELLNDDEHIMTIGRVLIILNHPSLALQKLENIFNELDENGEVEDFFENRINLDSYYDFHQQLIQPEYSKMLNDAVLEKEPSLTHSLNEKQISVGDFIRRSCNLAYLEISKETLHEWLLSIQKDVEGKREELFSQMPTDISFFELCMMEKQMQSLQYEVDSVNDKKLIELKSSIENLKNSDVMKRNIALLRLILMTQVDKNLLRHLSK
ncbi:hypothetical protein [Vibrio parahaemolyticus]|uniref:hypothetical protein n=2 Tax=Vibrio parahaemolyticus TaxID=670 RepID=UPI0010D00142|nr:hypothetical protein [Vibrio parahaemolyticus]HDY7668812.1 hypothetical protein [Vibrio vulnificus]EGR2855003.1 hypothetical protein [Vibrio parahaemolyticus]EGR2988032.1 hypothetical protein [Vibrio parahaemolyticus]MCX8796099.1 hypothetical protein [Vibrio parahaemolyticus]TBT51441.1 hypothetical protein D5E78_06480 [Vibrio parahaemolyticus]